MKWFLRQETEPTTTRFLKVTINDIIAAYLYGSIECRNLGSFMVSLMDGNGKLWLLVVEIPKYGTYSRPR